MWNCWYAPSKWQLWARSAYPKAIPRKHTTMTVEAVWRKLKRISLALNNRPRLDYVVHILATKTVPSYRVVFASVTYQLRSSRTQALTSDQKSFKKAWLRLRSRTIKGQYDTDPVQWTCNCGAQKYHAHLLCKHLVASVDIPSENWWPLALRSRTAPFYFVPGTCSEHVDSHESGQYHWLPACQVSCQPCSRRCRE